MFSRVCLQRVLTWRKESELVMDTVSDALIRIKNGYLASKTEVNLPYSKLVLAICDILKAEGYLLSAKVDGRMIKTLLKYQGHTPAFSDVKRISKPGLRVYKGSKELPRVLGGMGIALVSTPKGVMTDRSARKQGLGGEIIAFVW